MMGVLSRPRPGQNRRYAYGYASIPARNTSRLDYPNHTHFIGHSLDRGELPDRSLSASEPADVEAVDADQLTGPLDVDMALWLWVSWWLVGRCVACD